MASIRTVASLIAALTILQLAMGLLGVVMPLAMAANQFSTASIGLVGAAYSAGFMAGAFLGPASLARIGHIRVFAAAGALATALVLALHWAGDVPAWLLNRFATGAAVALLFAAAESWMNSAMGQTERGNVIGFYMVCTKAALAIGPFLTGGARPSAPEPLMTSAMLLAVALAPICITSRAQPEPPQAQPLAIRALYATAPAAVLASFGAGMINSGVLMIAPLYAHDQFGPGAAVGFQSAAWIGSLLLQWPAGRLSDRVDRRLVIAGLLGLAGAAALTLALIGASLDLRAAAFLFALWGAGALSFYGIGVAHMADRAEPGQMARATAGLLFVWAGGSVLGPFVLGLMADWLGAAVMFWYAAVLSFVLAGAMVWRRAAREVARLKMPFRVNTATSIAVSELAYGEAENEQAES